MQNSPVSRVPPYGVWTLHECVLYVVITGAELDFCDRKAAVLLGEAKEPYPEPLGTKQTSLLLKVVFL